MYVELKQVYTYTSNYNEIIVHMMACNLRASDDFAYILLDRNGFSAHHTSHFVCHKYVRATKQ